MDSSYTQIRDMNYDMQGGENRQISNKYEKVSGKGTKERSPGGQMSITLCFYSRSASHLTPEVPQVRNACELVSSFHVPIIYVSLRN